MDETGKKLWNLFSIDSNERLYLDGVELTNVISYQLKHSAGEPTELMLTMHVMIGQSDSE